MRFWAFGTESSKSVQKSFSIFSVEIANCRRFLDMISFAFSIVCIRGLFVSDDRERTLLKEYERVSICKQSRFRRRGDGGAAHRLKKREAEPLIFHIMVCAHELTSFPNA
jgi:hypothetical protein